MKLSTKQQNGKKKSVLTMKICAFLMALLCLFSSCRKADPEGTLPATGKSGASVSSGNLWYDKFVAWDNANSNYYLSTQNSASLAWGESYYMRSYIKLYELTKSTAWLDKFVTHADIILTRVTDLGSDGYLDWRTADYGDGGQYPYLVHDGMISLPLAEFVRLIDQNPTLDATYGTKADTYQNFIETEIVPKWVTSSSYVGNCWVQVNSTTGYFKEPATINSLPNGNFNPLPYNMMAPYAQMLWVLYDVNGNASYKNKADQMANYFKSGLITNGSGTNPPYKWWYCNISSPHIEDTSHGNLEMEMAIDAYNRGVIFNGGQLARFSNTFTDKMWNQSTSAPKVKDYVDGTGTTYADSRPIYGYLLLTQANAIAWTIGAEQYRSTAATHSSEAFTLVRIMEWDPVKVHNQGFEYKFFNDATLPARWIRSGGTSSNIRLYTADKYSGKACVAITSAAGDGTWQMLYQDWKQWKPNTSYEITFNVKTSGAAGARIFMRNTTTGTNVGTVHDYDSAGWSTQSFTFTTPAAGPNLRLYLENHDLSTDGTAFFDNVVIKQVGDSW